MSTGLKPSHASPSGKKAFTTQHQQAAPIGELEAHGCGRVCADGYGSRCGWALMGVALGVGGP